METPTLFEIDPSPDTWHTKRRVGFDLETTGRDPRTARIVAASLVVADPADSDARVREWLIDPGVEIPEEASEVHGISTEQARAEGQDPAEAIPQLLESVVGELDAGVPLIICNAPYDLTVLAAEAMRHGLLLENPRPIIDPLVIDRQVDRYRRGKRRLTDLAEHYGVELAEAHSATPDALCAVGVSDTMASRYPQLQISAEELHDLQISWKAEQAADLQEYFRRRRPDAVVDPTWPVYRV